MPDSPPVGQQQLAISTHVGADGVVVIHIVGEIDLAAAPQVRAALRTSLTGPALPTQVRVDLAAASFIDAAGVGALVDGREAARRAGVGFSIDSPTGVVRRVLDILGLTDALHLDRARPTTPPVRPSGPGGS